MSSPDWDEKLSNLESKVSKESFWKKCENGNLRNETLNKSNKNWVESIINRLDQLDERISMIDDKGKEVLPSDLNKEKNHNHIIEDLWDTISWPNLQICSAFPVATT